jgi:uncharacterized protein (DUF2252 family)
MKQAVRRTWQHFFDERLEGKREAIPIGRRFWPLTREERDAVRAFVETEQTRKLVTSLASRDDSANVSFVDAAFWVKGCSSLGLWRVAVLVAVEDRTKKGKKRNTVCLLDIKQAVDASAPWSPGHELAIAPGERVLTGARTLAPALGSRMIAGTILDRSVFVRELLPQDLKVELDHISDVEGRSVASYLGLVVGRAHGRQLDEATRRAWHRDMASHRSKNIDAPSWLWTSLVELVAVHEQAYLEHCRRHALAAARAADGESPPPPAEPEREPAKTPTEEFTTSVAAESGEANA